MRRRTAARNQPSLMGTMARTALIAGTATAVSGSVAGRQQKKRHAQAAQAQQAAAPPPPAPPAGSDIDGDLVEQLKALDELRQAGILTEEEFAAKKAQLLGV